MSKFGNVSAAGGFDQSEIDFVTRLISSGQATIDEVANNFGVDRDVVQAVYNENAPAQTEQNGLFETLSKGNTLFNSGVQAVDALQTFNALKNTPSVASTAATTMEELAANNPMIIQNLSGAGSDGVKLLTEAEKAAQMQQAADVFAGGLGSIVGAVSGKESIAETAGLGLLGALGLINPATALAYRIFDAFDFFGGGGSKATPMTPEEAAKYAGETRLDQAVGQFAEGGEGAGEFLLDAIDQAKAANVEPEKIAETLNSRGNMVADLINLTVGSNEMFVADEATTADAQAASQAAADAAMGGGDQTAAGNGDQAATQDETLDIFQDTTASDLDLNLPQAQEVFTYDAGSNVFISNTTGEAFPAGDVNDVDIRDGGVYSVRPVLGADGQVVAEHVVDESGQDVAKVDQVDGKAILRVIPNVTNVFDTTDNVATVPQGNGDLTNGNGDTTKGNGDLGDGGLNNGGSGTDFESATDTKNTGVTLTKGSTGTSTTTTTDGSGVTTGTGGTSVTEGQATTLRRSGGGEKELFAAIQQTPTTSILFMPQMRELDNVTLGMFDAFLKASGGRS